MYFIKKIFGLMAIVSLVLFACKKSDAPINAELAENEATGTFNGLRICAAEEVLKRQLLEDPTLQQRMDEIESAIQKRLQQPELYKLDNQGNMTIDVVVNVIYRTAAENISDLQVRSQIDVLNQDFQASNSDYSKVPTSFNSVKSGDTKIRFVLVQTRRKYSNKTSWTTNDAMKKTKQGGLDPLDPTTKLNIWVCNLGTSLLGYAQFPGGSPSTDGVVIHTKAFGTKADSTFNLYADYNLGRTATHEVGHWFNLRHIWGDATCGNDQVGDTPQHNGPNYKCPTSDHTSTCTGAPLEMWMNFMDYTYDGCMYMFTQGQAQRMQLTWDTGGPRSSYR